MILLDNKELDIKRFPDHTLALRVTPSYSERTLTWLYESDEEMATIYFITKHLQSKGDSIILYLPYIPNSRMDRVKNNDEIFTLKYFADFINSLSFKYVIIKDPHSNVSGALINNLYESECVPHIMAAIREINDKGLVLYYPDEGAMKRYSDIIKNIPYAFGIKRRDWRSGEIQGITLINEEVVKDKNILIVDDICSKGGTFFHSAKALKEAGAKDVFLYVTHCENTIHEGELLNSDLIKHIYTTRSILTKTHEKITIFE